jgi:hypothetical protein
MPTLRVELQDGFPIESGRTTTSNDLCPSSQSDHRSGVTVFALNSQVTDYLKGVTPEEEWHSSMPGETAFPYYTRRYLSIIS